MKNRRKRGRCRCGRWTTHVIGSIVCHRKVKRKWRGRTAWVFYQCVACEEKDRPRLRRVWQKVVKKWKLKSV
jgi:hypothetical protein